MTDNPDTRPMEAAAIPVSDTSHAPFIFYEGVRTSGHTKLLRASALQQGRDFTPSLDRMRGM